jgi:hypothetical protein
MDRYEICCNGKGRGEHPERLIATLTDNRRGARGLT